MSTSGKTAGTDIGFPGNRRSWLNAAWMALAGLIALAMWHESAAQPRTDSQNPAPPPASIEAAKSLPVEGRAEESEARLREGLEIARATFGEDDSRTATAYFDLAVYDTLRGRHAEAVPLYRSSLAIRRKVLGEDQIDTAHSYNGLACALSWLSRPAEAEPLHRKALEIRLRRLGEDHLDTAHSYTGLAWALGDLGRMAEAESPRRRGLAIRVRLLGEEHRDTIESYDGLATTLYNLGRYEEAEELLRKVLKARIKLFGEDDLRTLSTYRSLFGMLNSRGQNIKTEAIARRILAICRNREVPPGLQTVDALTHLAFVLEGLKQPESGEPLLRESLNIVLRICGAGHPRVGSFYGALGLNLSFQGRYAEAEACFRKAADLVRRAVGDEDPMMAHAYQNLAMSLSDVGKSDEALTAWTSAAVSLEAARMRVGLNGTDRLAFSRQFKVLPCLAAILARRGNPTDAWDRLETSLSRGLLDDLSRSLDDDERRRQADLAGRLQSVEEQIRIQTSTTAVTPAELDHNRRDELIRRSEAIGIELKDFDLEMAKKHGPAAGRVFALTRIQEQIPADAALIAWLDVDPGFDRDFRKRERWACAIRRRGAPAWIEIRGTGVNREPTDSDRLRTGYVGAILARRPEGPSDEWRKPTRELEEQCLEVIEPALVARGDLPEVTRLIVVPSGAMAGIPIEAMLEARPERRTRYTVSYAPSGTIYAWLRERRSTPREVGDRTGPPRLLALGDPAFPDPTQGSSMPISSRAGPLQKLPGTRREIQAISRLFERAETLLGPDANENRLDEMARSGRLREFQFLHLATHGKLDRDNMLRSALLLAQAPPLGSSERGSPAGLAHDGEVTAEQIIRTWTLDADLVTLSACQTALGTRDAGEDFVGFSQALFLAGARSVLLSLWNVDDAATAFLMTRFYQNLLGHRPGLQQSMPKAKALAEAKQWLRTLSASDADLLGDGLPGAERLGRVSGPLHSRARSTHPYEHPYFWAAFILIGDPD